MSSKKAVYWLFDDSMIPPGIITRLCPAGGVPRQRSLIIIGSGSGYSQFMIRANSQGVCGVYAKEAQKVVNKPAENRRGLPRLGPSARKPEARIQFDHDPKLVNWEEAQPRGFRPETPTSNKNKLYFATPTTRMLHMCSRMSLTSSSQTQTQT